MSFIQKVKNKVESIGDETVKEVDYMGEKKKPEPDPPKAKKEKPKKEIKTPKFKRPELPKLPQKKEKESEIEHDFNNDLVDDYEDEYDYIDDDVDNDNNDNEFTYDHNDVVETVIVEESYSYDDPVVPDEVVKTTVEKEFVKKDARDNYKEILDSLKISEQVIVPDNVLLEDDCKKISFGYQSPYGYDMTQVKEFSRVAGDSLKELTNLIKKRNKEIIQLAKEAIVLKNQIEHNDDIKNTLEEVQLSHIEELKDKNSNIADLKTSINNLRKDIKVKSVTLEKVKKAKLTDSENYKKEITNRESTIKLCEDTIQKLRKEKHNVEKENAEMMEALKTLMLQKEENIAKEKEIVQKQQRLAKEKEQNILYQIQQAEKEDDPEFVSAMEKIKSIITENDLNMELGIVNEKDDVSNITNDDLDIFVYAEEKKTHSDYNVDEELISTENTSDSDNISSNNIDDISIVNTVSDDVQEYIDNLENDDDSDSDDDSEEAHIQSIIDSLYDDSSINDDDSVEEEFDDDSVDYDSSVLNELLDIVEDSEDNEDMYDSIDEEEEKDIIVDDSNLSSILEELEEKEENVMFNEVEEDEPVIIDNNIMDEILEEVSFNNSEEKNSDSQYDDNAYDTIEDEVENVSDIGFSNSTRGSNILSDLLDDEDDDDIVDEADGIINDIDQTSKFSSSDNDVNYDDSGLDNKMSIFADSHDGDDDFSQYYDDEDDDDSSQEELDFLDNAKNYSDEEFLDIDMLNDMIKDNKQ